MKGLAVINVPIICICPVLGRCNVCGSTNVADAAMLIYSPFRILVFPFSTGRNLSNKMCELKILLLGYGCESWFVNRLKRTNEYNWQVTGRGIA
jgi:hypothetical protein